MRVCLPSFRRSTPAALLFAGLTGCAGGALATTVTQPSPIAAPDAFRCIREQLTVVEFAQTAYDPDRMWLKARRFDESQRRPDTQFRRMVDRLDIEVTPGTGEALSTITAEASTFAELTTQRGPTEVQEKTSATAIAAAQTILRNCSQAAGASESPPEP